MRVAEGLHSVDRPDVYHLPVRPNLHHCRMASVATTRELDTKLHRVSAINSPSAFIPPIMQARMWRCD